MIKHCAKCGVDTEHYIYPNGKSRYCKVCMRAAQKKFHDAQPNYYREWRKEHPDQRKSKDSFLTNFRQKYRGKCVVYGHYLPGDDIPFYVGCGKPTRPHQLDSTSRSKLWQEIVSERNGGQKPLVKILCVVETKAAAERVEIRLIVRWQPHANVVWTPKHSRLISLNHQSNISKKAA